VTTQHQQGNLNENSISGYAQSHRFEEVTIGLSLLCSLPADVIERALADKNREMLLVLAESPRLFLADHNVIAVSGREGSPHHRARPERPGKGVWPPQPRDIAQRSEILSDTQECRR
jgi:hypothetical protein